MSEPKQVFIKTERLIFQSGGRETFKAAEPNDPTNFNPRPRFHATWDQQDDGSFIITLHSPSGLELAVFNRGTEDAEIWDVLWRLNNA